VCENRGMNLLERLRSFWKIRSAGDHPLTEQERDESSPATAYDERARGAEEFVGGDFDPDERETGPTD
jgi:hypothetical protein